MSQIDNVIKAATEYARAQSGEKDGDQFRMCAASYLSGCMAASQGLAASDGVHPSKLAEAVREAAAKMLGVKDQPGYVADVVSDDLGGRLVRDSGDQIIAVNTSKSTTPLAGPIARGKIHVTFVRYKTVEWDEHGSGFNDRSFAMHDANQPEAKTIAGLVNL